MFPTAQLITIPYFIDSANWFYAIRHLQFAIWLDSGHPLSTYGRYDILSAAPSVTLETHAETTLITQINGLKSSSTSNPFQLLREQLITTTGCPELPFSGGALGYFSYDLGRRLEDLPQIAAQDIDLPEMCIGIYPWAIVQDHQQKTAWLVINKALAPTYNFSEIEQIIQFPNENSGINRSNLLFNVNKFDANLNAEKYSAALRKIHDYIIAGDCYQVNFAQRFSSEYQGDPFTAYLKLRTALPSPFSAFMQLQQGAILSLSPERFLSVTNNIVETKPIKGTIARGLTPEDDISNAATLMASEKDCAENLMIVDLLRNDLSKTCNRVKVTELFSLQSFTNVHHLVSTITATLNPNTNVVDLLASSFPGGSITGAPKIRAMEIIEELEPTRRSIYCGSIGYISTCGNMDTNIAIRTMVCDNSSIYCWGGGGIVADSITETEHQESVAKVKVLMDTLEQNFAKSY